MKTGRDQTNGTTYVHEGAKDYYLKIGAANIQNYNIKIEYDSSAPIPEFSTIAVIIAIALASTTILALKKRMQNQKNR